MTTLTIDQVENMMKRRRDAMLRVANIGPYHPDHPSNQDISFADAEKLARRKRVELGIVGAEPEDTEEIVVVDLYRHNHNMTPGQAEQLARQRRAELGISGGNSEDLMI